MASEQGSSRNVRRSVKAKAGAGTGHAEGSCPSDASLKGKGKEPVSPTTGRTHPDVGTSILAAGVGPSVSGQFLFKPLPSSLKFTKKVPVSALPELTDSSLLQMPHEAASSSSQIPPAPHALPERSDVGPSHPAASASSCVGSEISPYDLAEWKWVVTDFQSIVPVENRSTVVYSNDVAELQPYSWDFQSQSLVRNPVFDLDEERERAIQTRGRCCYWECK